MSIANQGKQEETGRRKQEETGRRNKRKQEGGNKRKQEGQYKRKQEGESSLPGRKAVAPRNSDTALALSGLKLTSAICLFNSWVALSAEPAARWSAAWEESAHHVTGGGTPAVGTRTKSDPASI